MSPLPHATAAIAASRLACSSRPERRGGIGAKWADLVEELDRWGEEGRVATLWWRDDDAIAATRRLDDLLRLATDIPLALAVIPALARPELAAAVAGRKQVAVLQHGWLHANRAADGKKSEYPASRPFYRVERELAAGKARLAALFGGRALPVLVPPWNRLAAELLPLLPRLGIAGLSAMFRPDATVRPPGLAAIDVHVDLVAWKGDRGFIGEAAALGALAGHLQAARLGAGRIRPPIGILTHHLVTDAATTAFVEQLIAVTKTHPAVRWIPVAELLP